jgi:hypothetical protein
MAKEQAIIGGQFHNFRSRNRSSNALKLGSQGRVRTSFSRIFGHPGALRCSSDPSLQGAGLQDDDDGWSLGIDDALSREMALGPGNNTRRLYPLETACCRGCCRAWCQTDTRRDSNSYSCTSNNNSSSNNIDNITSNHDSTSKNKHTQTVGNGRERMIGSNRNNDR